MTPTTVSGPREALAALHRRHQHAHRDGEERGQHAAQQQHRPPDDSEAAVRLRQRREELPLLTLTQTLKHVTRRLGGS